MNSENPDREEFADILSACARQCRRAQSAEEAHQRLYGQPWDQGLLERFGEQFAESPELLLAARMIYAQGYSRLAESLLPALERCLGRHACDEFSAGRPPEPLRPELVVDNTHQDIPASARARGKSKGKRAAQRPAGDAA